MEEGRRQGPGRCGAGPTSGRDWEAAFPPSLARTGQGTGMRLISCPALCPPRPSSAFLIHSEGSGLCFQHTSKGSQAGSFWNFPWELVSWSFLSTKRQNPVRMEINVAKLDLCLSERAGQTDIQCTRKRNSAGGPGHHLATWGGSSALGVMKPPLLPPRPTRNHKSTGVGVSNCGLFPTNAQVPDDDTDPSASASKSFPPGGHTGRQRGWTHV